MHYTQWDRSESSAIFRLTDLLILTCKVSWCPCVVLNLELTKRFFLKTWYLTGFFYWFLLAWFFNLSYLLSCTGSITPTVELNGLAMKRGEPAIYRPLDPKPMPNYRANYNFRGMFNQRWATKTELLLPKLLISLVLKLCCDTGVLFQQWGVIPLLSVDKLHIPAPHTIIC